MMYPDEKQLGLLTNLYRAMFKQPLEAQEEALLKAATKQLYRRFSEDDGTSKEYRGALLSDLINSAHHAASGNAPNFIRAAFTRTNTRP
jgi:hypothetical protein